jgi:hypothetical protein
MRRYNDPVPNETRAGGYEPGGPAARQDFDDYDGMDREDILRRLAQHGCDLEVIGGADDAVLAEMLRVCEAKDDEAAGAGEDAYGEGEDGLLDGITPRDGRTNMDDTDDDGKRDLRTAKQFCEKFSEQLAKTGQSAASVMRTFRAATPDQRRELATGYRRHLGR